MTLAAVSPALIGAGLVWWLVGPGWALILLAGAAFIGGRALLRKR